ncbi:hypothetical protein CAPTEDRAFT_205919 [Capitella teleta]|uniref:G-protein coupled receptors family 1 profile domain-containing protein n=1 Tax=Capitella teleta TaxID=283909 RepID=R7U8R6_CAPTE|nr:hypothetical protein CAPTEDRAFT_205919 [Capitella teleta]|eukprot:ELU02369.1 hypothetical protein CAPTEDRAFT_205919 [Capitella teleta]
MTEADFTTESATELSETIDPRIEDLENIAKQVWLVGSPLLIIVGTLGNLLTIWIFMRSPKLRSTSTSLYLIVLAVADTLLLYIGLLRQYSRVKYEMDFRTFNSFLCKVGLFGVYFMVHFEAWILVNVTLERFAAVFIPHKVKQLFSKKRAALSIGLTGGILFLFNVHYWWEAKLIGPKEKHYCTVQNAFYQSHWPRIDLALASAIPFIVIFTMNCVIIIRIAMRSKGLTGSKSSKTSSMTAILISVSITFLVFTLPITIHLIQYNNAFYDMATQLEVAQSQVHWAVVNIVYYLNNSTNFFLYCISGPRFRREFLALICKNRVQPNSQATVTATQTIET